MVTEVKLRNDSYIIRTSYIDADDDIIESGASLVSYLGGTYPNVCDHPNVETWYDWHIVCDEPTLAWVLLRTGGTLAGEPQNDYNLQHLQHKIGSIAD